MQDYAERKALRLEARGKQLARPGGIEPPHP